MYDEVGKTIDAVTVSTPDHTHAVAAAMGMRLGKHAFVQKPMTKSLWEARVLGQLAAEKNLATQMGNQGSAEDGLRRAVEVVQAGLIGPVREVHVWSNRPIWPQGMDRRQQQGRRFGAAVPGKVGRRDPGKFAVGSAAACTPAACPRVCQMGLLFRHQPPR